MGRRGIIGLKARVGRECCISRASARLNNGAIETERVRGGIHSVTMRCNCGSHSGGRYSVSNRNAAGAGSSWSEICQEF